MLNYSFLQCHNILLIGTFILLTKTLLVSALYVVESSNCTALCNGPHTSSTTNLSDVSCYDDDYNTTGTGVSFRSCISCELNSDAVDTQSSRTDIGWALFNMRYTLDQCLYNDSRSENQTPAAQCVSPCSAIKSQLEINLDQPNASTPYDYCAGSSFQENAQQCAQCYRIIDNQIYLSNFLNTLATACEPLSSPFPVASSDIFTTHPPSNFTNTNHDGGLSHNGKVAIAIAVPVVIFAVLSIALIICFVYRSTRRRRKTPQSKSRALKPIKRVSPTTTSSSPENVRFPRDIHPAFQSKDASDESRHARLSSPLSRYTPERIPLPRPMKARKSHLSFKHDDPVHEDSHPAQGDQFGFTKRVEVPVPNTTPREYTSEEEDHGPKTRKVPHARAPAKPDLSTDPLPLFFAISSEEYKKSKRPQSQSNMTATRSTYTPKPPHRSAAPTSAYSINRGPRISIDDERTTTRGLKPPSQSQHSRLLTGSPFDAQSLATLGTVTEAETASRAPTSRSSRTPRHTPSHSSSNRRQSDATRTPAPPPLDVQTIPIREQVHDPALGRALASTAPHQLDSDPSPSSMPEQVAQAGASTREKVNDPALSRAIAPSIARERSTRSPTKSEGISQQGVKPLQNEQAQDTKLPHGTATMLARDNQSGALPTTAEDDPSIKQEKIQDPALMRALEPSVKQAKARELSFPVLAKLPLPVATREQIKDPALSRAMPSSPVLRPLAPLAPPSPSQERSYTPEPKMHADTGLPSYHDLARQIAQAQAKASLTDLRGASLSPKTSKVQRSSSTRSKVHGSRASSSRSRTPKSSLTTSVRLTPNLRSANSFSPQMVSDDARSVSPGTVPGARPLEKVQEEPQRRPTSPISPGTISASEQPPVRTEKISRVVGPATVDYLNARPHGRRSTPISPGTLPGVTQTLELQPTGNDKQLESDVSDPVFSRPPEPPVFRIQGISTAEQHRPDTLMRRPTSPISPGTIPPSGPPQQITEDQKSNPRPDLFRRPTSPISPGTIPADRRHSSLLLQEPPSKEHLRPPKSPRPQSEISPKTIPTARFRPASPISPQRDHSVDSTIFYLDTSLSSGDGSASVASSGFIPLQRQESRGALLAGQGIVIRGAGIVRPSRGNEHGGRPAEERGAEQHDGENVGIKWKGIEGDDPTATADAAALRRADVRNSRGKRLGQEMFKTTRFEASEE